MVSVTRFCSLITRNVRTALRVSVRHYDPETGGEEFKATSVTMLSKEDDENIYVEAYSTVGFKLNSGFRIIGPCVLFPRSVLHWGIAGAHDINEKTLSLFPLLEPKLDILILGIGDYGTKYDKSIIKYLRSHRINVEILPTDQACATFNFLNAERRVVAAGLVPPTYMHLENDEDLIIRAQLERQEELYSLKHDFHSSPLDNVPGELAPQLKILKEKILPKLGIPLNEEESEKKKPDEENSNEKR